MFARGVATGCLVLAALATDARADAAAEIGRLAAAAPDAAALAKLADRLSSATPQSAEPPQLESTADALGRLITRARDVEAGAALYARFAALARELGSLVRTSRARLETAAGEDEAALERLFRSDDWQRLDYADVMLGYWSGWAELSRAQLLAPGAERRASMQRARTAFARSSLELRLPQIATASLLGIGIALHELGDLAAARRALEGLERQLAVEDPGDLSGPALYELATVAYEQGDLEAAQGFRKRLPGASPQQTRALLQLEAGARIARAKSGGGGLDEAAALLRELADGGGEGARWAAATAAENWSLLEGRDVGPISALLRAESDFDAGRFAEARDGYAQVLAAPERVVGLDLATAQYKYARALAETGAEARAADELEQLLAGGGGAPVRDLAASLFYALAERLAAAESGAAADARALAAARTLIGARPDAPEAGAARLRVARADPGRAVEQLDRIGPDSPAYPAALLDRVRLRSAELQRREARGRPVGDAARGLAADLDALHGLSGAGRLAPDPRRDATLAVLRAKAADWTGEAPDAVLSLVEAASSSPGLEPAERRALLRLRLRSLARAGRRAQLDALLTARSPAEIRDEWRIWRETLAALAAARAPADTLLRWYERLGPLAPRELAFDFALDRTRALLDLGRAADARAAAQALVDARPDSGDARLLRARALDATGARAEAAQAWLEIAARVEAGQPTWVRAQLAAAAASRAAGDPAAACRSVRALRDARPEPDAELRAQLDELGAGCAPPAAGPGYSGK